MGNQKEPTLFAVIKGFFGKKEKSSQDLLPFQQSNIVWQQEMAHHLQFLLKEVESRSDIKLPQEKIAEFMIRERISQMLKFLETTRVTKTDETELNKLISDFMEYLRTALRNGYVNMSYWAAISLTHSMEILRLEASESDNEALLYKCKLDYANTLGTIIAGARAVDEAIRKLERLNAERKENQQELTRRLELANGVMQSKDGSQKIQVIRQKVENKVALTDEETEIFENLVAIRDLKHCIITIDDQIRVTMHVLKSADDDIQRYQLLINPPLEEADSGNCSKEDVVSSIQQSIEEMLAPE